MTLEDLAEKIDSRLMAIDSKVDDIRATMAAHSQSIAYHDQEVRELRERLMRVEKGIWASLGAGAATGIGVAKFFF